MNRAIAETYCAKDREIYYSKMVAISFEKVLGNKTSISTSKVSFNNKQNVAAVKHQSNLNQCTFLVAHLSLPWSNC